MLPDLLAPGLDVIFCGTAAGKRSAERGHYYAGPGNRFWPTLAEIGLTGRLFTPEEDHLLPGLGLGFTDLAKDVAGTDSQIPASAYTPKRLADVVAQWRPRAVAFTSLTAARIALGARHDPGRTQHGALPGTVIWVLPSPSGLARGHFRIEPWRDLALWRRQAA
ncbi:MAG: mismatch-specific DNA-glycosylase [Cereibacter sphaeroides]|uniref:Mismatch-specific DNA-glycosylase n=1 Tax=Cereibacter sphaeroides TaxID=1063 RepID=A0A2W5SIN0_CERSP|nr:MAG: mismatch-specific DNA-glycosylase [Cereibacter sphaeroides]